MTIYSIIALAIVAGLFYMVFKILKGLFSKNGGISDSGAMICQNCGTRGEPKTITRGSIAIELVLWLCFLIPGLIYSLWRLTTKQSGCPACGSLGMMSVNTPNGRLLLEKFHPQSKGV